MFKQFTAAALLAALAVPAGAVTVDLEGAVGHALEADPRISEREHLVDVARALLQEATGSDDLFLDLNMFLAIAPEADGFYTCSWPSRRRRTASTPTGATAASTCRARSPTTVTRSTACRRGPT
jgi:hypothetical protein